MGSDEGILGDFFSILLISEELVHHGKDAIPITGDHFVESGLVSALEPVDKQTIEGYFVGFGGHTVCLALMGIFLNCSHDLQKGRVLRQLDRRGQ